VRDGGTGMKYYYMIMNFVYADYEDFLNDVADPGWVPSSENAMLSTGLFEHIDAAFEKTKDLMHQALKMCYKEKIDRCEESPLEWAAIIFKDGTVSSYQVVKMEVHK
jgi:hypothetical protein